VVEVGLGGRLDATNLVQPAVSVITTIAKDHEAYLGSDLLSIAREKGGIIKKGVPVVCGSLAPEVRELLRDMAARAGCASHFLGDDFSIALKDCGLFDYNGLSWSLGELALGLRGRHQRSNAALALAALEIARSAFPVSEASVREGLKTVFWPGRCEIVRERPRVVLDGAHNLEGVIALTEEMRRLSGARGVKLLFAALEDKDWSGMLAELSQVAREAVLTRVPMARGADPWKMAATLGDRLPHAVVEDPPQALHFLLDRAGPEDVVLVAGSLYLLGAIRPLLVCDEATELPKRESGGAAL
jgi:dihydrofolate synthase/folylpolyglutamate synthase